MVILDFRLQRAVRIIGAAIEDHKRGEPDVVKLKALQYGYTNLPCFDICRWIRMDVKTSTSIVNSGQSKENVRKIRTTWSALLNMQAVAAKAARSVEDTNTLSILYKDRMNVV
jgi:hypothetical protein